MRASAFVLSLGLMVAVAACDPYPPTPKPDLAIRVVPTAAGLKAVPPDCLNWTTATTDPYDNQPLPQFGCATARNLAMMVERPEDLVKGRELGPANGVTAVGSMVRYNHNQTRGLLWTGTDPNTVATTTSSTATSALSGEAAASSPSAGSTAAPAAP